VLSQVMKRKNIRTRWTLMLIFKARLPPFWELPCCGSLTLDILACMTIYAP
jgi:hypothetical protein